MRAIANFLADDKEQLTQRIVFLVVMLFCVGLFFLFYAYIADINKGDSVGLLRGIGVQIAAFIVGLGALYAAARVKYQVYKKNIFFIAGMSLAGMLLLITPLAVERNGAVRWVDLGVLQFQPSEILKLAFIIFFAFLFTHQYIRNNSKKLIVYTISAFALFGATSALQPDYGSMLIVGSAVFCMALIARLPKQWWIALIGSGMLAAGLLTAVAPSYLVSRFETFYAVNFGTVTLQQRYGSAYHTIQNQEAVRVGGLLGQGPGYVAQSSNLNIPEITTDSIFALIAAETGFVGSLTVIFLFLLFFFLCYTIADFTRDPFGRYIVVGITTLFAAQFFINILVVLGFPATGIPLMFFSKGGTSLVITLIAIGIILNVLKQQPRRREIYRGRL